MLYAGRPRVLDDRIASSGRVVSLGSSGRIYVNNVNVGLVKLSCKHADQGRHVL